MDWFDPVGRTAERIGEWKVVSYRTLRRAAAEAGVSSAEGEIYCLARGFVPSRYLRSMGTLGLEGQTALLQSSAAVIGCGGLGGYVAEILARAGVGRLVLVDSDVFDESNLNRQLLATEKTLGISKAREAVRRVEEINGSVAAEERQCRFDDYSAEGILDGIDVALDCLDNLPSRRTLYARCGERNIPVVTGAIGGFWGQVGVVLPGDPLMADFFPEGKGPGRKGTRKSPLYPRRGGCDGVRPGHQADHRKGSVLSGAFLWMDLREDEFSRLSLKKGVQSE
ncbi:HesA/MoeB/ThiF family protein [Aminivibrio sp.]